MKFSFLFLACFLFVGCSPDEGHLHTQKWMTPNGKIKILSTIAMIDDLVQEIAGPYADTETLISGQLDPHSYQLVKGDDEKLSVANIIFCNGLGLEHGPSLRNLLSESPKVISLGDLLKENHPELFLYYNGTVDPHVWMDMSLWLQTTAYIAQALITQDPSHAPEYLERAKIVRDNLMILHKKFIQDMEKVPETKRFLVTSHDAFNYFSRAYLATEEERKNGGWEKRFVAPEGLAPESQLSVSDIKNILGHMKKYGIQVVFPETNVSQSSIKKLMDAGKEMGIPVTIASESLYGDAMGPSGSAGDKYSKMIEYDVNTIIKYLK